MPKDFSPQRGGSGFQCGEVPLASHLHWRGQAGGRGGGEAGSQGGHTLLRRGGARSRTSGLT